MLCMHEHRATSEDNSCLGVCSKSSKTGGVDNEKGKKQNMARKPMRQGAKTVPYLDYCAQGTKQSVKVV